MRGAALWSPARIAQGGKRRGLRVRNARAAAAAEHLGKMRGLRAGNVMGVGSVAV